MAENPVITCPECKKKFKGKGNLTGKKIKCPLCSKPFIVPAPSKSEAVKADAVKTEPAAMAPEAPAPAKKIFEDEEEDKNPYGVTTLDIAARCPNCAQLMADDKAFICLHCGYNSLTREVGRTEKLISHTVGERFMHLLPGIASGLTALAFIIGMTWYSVVLPDMVYKSWASFLDAESLRMWFTIIALSLVWGTGLFAYKRLIVEPTPELKKKE